LMPRKPAGEQKSPTLTTTRGVFRIFSVVVVGACVVGVTDGVFRIFSVVVGATVVVVVEVVVVGVVTLKPMIPPGATGHAATRRPAHDAANKLRTRPASL
jgi:hypothetical protein